MYGPRRAGVTQVNHYTFRVSWSPEDGEYVGTALEFPSLSWLAEDENEAFNGIRQLVAGVVEDLLEHGEPAPEAIADRDFNGKVLLRVTPARHRAIALRAAEQGVSMNRYLNDVLADV
jgi:predicted HicB family RNase H-like nuclease